MITFDDGYEDAFTAVFPELVQQGFTATFYLITGRIGKPGYLNWEQAWEMKSAGMNIGSHTADHVNLRSRKPADLAYQIGASKMLLERILGPVYDFCYPGGDYSAQVISMVQHYGFLSAVTTSSRVASPNDSMFELPRIRMGNSVDLQKLLESGTKQAQKIIKVLSSDLI